MTPALTSLPRSVTTCTPATRLCTSQLLRINDSSPSPLSREVQMFAPVTEGAPNRSTTPPTGVLDRTGGIGPHNVG
jgi:hypothetical protein